MFFYFISSNIDEVFPINPSGSAFVFGDFNAHHKDWLTYPGATDRLVNYVIIFLSQVTLRRWLTFLFESQILNSHTLALLDLFISSVTIICSTMAFPLLGNSDHVVISVSIGFPSNSQRDAPFHWVAYDYSCADWEVL